MVSATEDIGNPQGLSWPKRLRLIAIWGMAVAQPIFSGMLNNSSFFLSFQLSVVQSVLLVFAIAWGPPLLLLLLLELIIRYGTPKNGMFLYWASLSVLIALLFLQCMKGWDWMDLGLQCVVALMAGIAIVRLANRHYAFRLYLSFLTPVIVIFPLLCLWNSQMFSPSFKMPPPTPQYNLPVKHPVPIVMVVFDEFPLLSLLNDKGEIDQKLFPHFAQLAQTSHWFKNAVTVHGSTEEAVPAILTGVYPPKASPTRCLIRSAQDLKFPNNLFSLLQHQYHYNVFEVYIHLCPDRLCKPARPLVTDEAPATALCPDSICKPVRPITSPSLSRYRDMAKVIIRAYIFDILMDRTQFAWYYYQFRHWTGRANLPEPHTHVNDVKALESFQNSLDDHQSPNTLYFVHPLLPHYSWELYPSGEHYSYLGLLNRTVQVCKNRPENPLCRLPWRSRVLEQRHLLQVGYVDTALGRIIDKLKKTGIYDKAIIIVTADHGVSNRPGEPIRAATYGNIQDIMLVPLFIKAPGQKQGVAHNELIQNTSILPTIADTLGVNVPWHTDGQSLFRPVLPEQKTVGICSGEKFLTINARDLLNKKEKALQEKTGFELFNLTPYRGWLNRTVSSSEASAFKLHILTPDLTQPTPLQKPLHWFGTIRSLSGKSPYIAATINNRIVSMTQVYKPFVGNLLFFDILLPESSLPLGNWPTIHFYEVQGPVDKPIFKSIQTE